MTLKPYLALAAVLGGTLSPVLAAPIACPDLSTAVQVATCPSEDELRYTYSVYCSDNQRMYDKDAITCTGLQHYRLLKNNALWESADGSFQGYLTCELPAATIKAAKPSSVAVDRAGTMNRVVCKYGDGHLMSHRTRAKCAPAADAAKCVTDPSACKVECE